MTLRPWMNRWLPVAAAPLLAMPLCGVAQVVQPEQSSMESADTPPAPSAGEPRRAWLIEPRITLQETFTDNVEPGSAIKSRDEITEVSPGIKISGRTPRLKLDFDYALRGLLYARGSRSDQTQHSLNTNARLEAVEKLLFVDVSGIITRQSISAFGVPSAANYSINANTVETSNFRVSPYLKGKLGGYADYEVRYSHSVAHSKNTVVADTETDDWRVRFQGDTRLARLGWAFEAERANYDFNGGHTAEGDGWKGLLAYRFDPQWKATVSAGRERNDFGTLFKETWNIYGYGLDWQPTIRTQVSAYREKRFFGYGHRVTVSHRLPLSAIRYTDNRDVSALPNTLGTTTSGSIFDLLFLQMASSIPDQAIRTDYINNLLRAQGISPDAPVLSGFLSSQLSVQRQQELSYVLRGARNTVTLSVARSRNERLGTLVEGGRDFALASSITQQGFSASWSHQLSALSTLLVSGTRARSTGVSSASLEANRRVLSAGITTRLGAKTQAGVMARRSVGDNPTTSYTENAVVGTVTIRF